VVHAAHRVIGQRTVSQTVIGFCAVEALVDGDSIESIRVRIREGADEQHEGERKQQSRDDEQASARLPLHDKPFSVLV